MVFKSLLRARPQSVQRARDIGSGRDQVDALTCSVRAARRFRYASILAEYCGVLPGRKEKYVEAKRFLH